MGLELICPPVLGLFLATITPGSELSRPGACDKGSSRQLGAPEEICHERWALCSEGTALPKENEPWRRGVSLLAQHLQLPAMGRRKPAQRA